MIRLIDAGVLPHPRSQTIYHAVAHARTHETPDTILFATPADPHVCIGLHQDVDREVDRDFCRDQGIPIVRRELGGGAVYLDRDQLFVQWVMGASRLPLRVEQRFEKFAAPIIATYAAFGINARFRPVNDIHVDGRKICGTGAAHIGDAEVLVGNFLFDFDTRVMANVLRIDSQKLRDKVRRGLDEYMTTMRQEMTQVPTVDAVKQVYRRECETLFGVPLVDGKLNEREREQMSELDVRLTSADFVGQPGGLERHGVKINEDVWVRETVHKAAGGLIRVAARTRAGRLEDVSLSGDFTLLPDDALARLERSLTGAALEATHIRDIVETEMNDRVQSPGVTPDDWVNAIMELAKRPETSSGATT